MPTTSAQHAERRPRVVGLWQSKDAAAWAAALARVPAVHAADPRLAAVDAARYAWLQTNPALADLSKVDVTDRCVAWMLVRNNARPIAHYTEALSQGQITGACRAAADALGASKKQPSLDQVEAAADALVALRGVGPGTASAILAAASPLIPFASDELAVAVFDDHHFKTVEEFVDLVRAARTRARELTAAGAGTWSARDVERALWAAARDASFVPPSKKKAGKKVEGEPVTPTGKAGKGAAAASPVTELKTRSGRVIKPASR